MKILNLYSGIGGNRHFWGDEHEITAIEINPEISAIYKEKFPNDVVINTDAHFYLLHHFQEFDFIWSSPPCPSHSRINISQYTRDNWTPRYPDMALYQEVIFLDNYYKGQYVVENVIPFYEPLIPAKKRGRHLYWCNFRLPNILSKRKNPDLSRTKNLIDAMSEFHDYDFRKYKGKQRMNKIARNLVDYEAGKTILDTAMGVMIKQDTKQTELW